MHLFHHLPEVTVEQEKRSCLRAQVVEGEEEYLGWALEEVEAQTEIAEEAGALVEGEQTA